MLSVITKTSGTLKMRNTESNSLCLVTKPKRITKDTQVTTRTTNNIAPNKPGRLIINLIPHNLKINNGSPGVKVLNNAGMAIKRENRGINTQVLFKKKPKLILEKYANKRHTRYRDTKSGIVLIKSTEIRNSVKDAALMRGSIDCRNPFFRAMSSEKTDSLKKEMALKIERSIKLLFLKPKVNRLSWLVSSLLTMLL